MAAWSPIRSGNSGSWRGEWPAEEADGRSQPGQGRASGRAKKIRRPALIASRRKASHLSAMIPSSVRPLRQTDRSGSTRTSVGHGTFEVNSIQLAAPRKCDRSQTVRTASICFNGWKRHLATGQSPSASGPSFRRQDSRVATPKWPPEYGLLPGSSAGLISYGP